jgi:dynactin complex subunit
MTAPKGNARDAAQTLNEPWETCKDGHTVFIRVVEDDEISAISDEEEESSSAYTRRKIKVNISLTSDKRQATRGNERKPPASLQQSVHRTFCDDNRYSNGTMQLSIILA